MSDCLRAFQKPAHVMRHASAAGVDCRFENSGSRQRRTRMFWRLSTLLFAIAAFCGPALAGPISGDVVNGDLRAELADNAIIKVRGCHRDTETHYMPRLRRTAPHYHTGRRCSPHVVRILPRIVHCHRSFSRHYHRGFGRNWHRHVGRDCTPSRGRSHRGPHRPRGDCVRFGSLWICP